VIDAGDPVGKLVNRDAYVFRQLGSGALHAVAKTGIFNVGVIVDCPANDGHRVGIIQQPGMGTEFFHVAADVHDDRHVAARVENAADPGGIADRLGSRRISLAAPGPAM